MVLVLSLKIQIRHTLTNIRKKRGQNALVEKQCSHIGNKVSDEAKSIAEDGTE
jgi:hypothetical protein